MPRAAGHWQLIPLIKAPNKGVHGHHVLEENECAHAQYGTGTHVGLGGKGFW